jgi:hypothetical protein
MKLKPRHLVAALLLIAQAPILAALAAGWLLSGLLYGVVVGAERAWPYLRAAGASVRQRVRDRASWGGRPRRPPRRGRPAWGW